MIEGTCENCLERPARHTKSQRGEPAVRLCCRCHINDGGSPADFHEECMAHADALDAHDGCQACMSRLKVCPEAEALGIADYDLPADR